MMMRSRMVFTVVALSFIMVSGAVLTSLVLAQSADPAAAPGSPAGLS